MLVPVGEASCFFRQPALSHDVAEQGGATHLSAMPASLAGRSLRSRSGALCARARPIGEGGSWSRHYPALRLGMGAELAAIAGPNVAGAMTSDPRCLVEVSNESVSKSVLGGLLP